MGESPTPRESSDAIARLIAAGEELARCLHAQSARPPKPAPCVPHRRTDGLHDCPNCLALAEWEDAKRDA